MAIKATLILIAMAIVLVNARTRANRHRNTEFSMTRGLPPDLSC